MYPMTNGYSLEGQPMSRVEDALYPSKLEPGWTPTTTTTGERAHPVLGITI